MGLRETLGESVLVSLGKAETKRFGFEIMNVVVGANVAEEQALARLKALAWNPEVHYHVRCNMAYRQVCKYLQTIPSHRLFVADPLIYWRLKFDDISSSYLTNKKESKPELRLLGDDDGGALTTRILSIFENYVTHWHYVPPTDHLRAEEAYAEWMALSLKDPGSRIYEYIEDDFCGILAARIDAEYTDILLAGVASDARGSGAYARMLKNFVSLAREMGLDCVSISTQSSNIRVQRIWATVGFKPTQSIAVAHLVPQSF